MNPFSLDNVNLLNEWICEASSFFYGYELSWETIETHLSTLILNDEEIQYDNKDKLSENNYLLKYLVDEFLYMSSLDQNLYLYVNNRDNI